MSTPITPLFAPPPQGTPMSNDAWTRWLYALWGTVGQGLDNSGPQGTYPKLRVDKATFDNSFMVQDLLKVDKGIYSTYYSSVNGIIYGFACNVHRATGTNFVVGAQLNAWAERGVSCPVYGLAITAIAQPGSVNCPLVGFEPDVANADDTNTARKVAIDAVFKNRGDGVAAVANGLGGNLYNYDTYGMIFTAQGRSSAGEYCGWSVGLDFLDYWGDQTAVPAWSAVVSYRAGQVVTSGGLLWKSITGAGNLNQLPAGGSAFWVQRTAAGVVNLAVGIDFSSMSVGAMARMASAIRLRNTQYIHLEETGAVGLRMNGATGNVEISNQGVVRFGVNVATGALASSLPVVALGGGAGAALGTIGGAGPTVAAQNSWGTLTFNGVLYFFPLWV